MLKLSGYWIVILMLLPACEIDEIHPFKEGVAKLEDLECEFGQMSAAWYRSGINEKPPSGIDLDRIELKNKLSLIVDSSFRSENFISSYEHSLRENVDSENYLQNLERADSLHKKYNQGQQQVWLLNNTTAAIEIMLQDGSFMCVLQAKIPGMSWRQVEYWQLSWCGNSYEVETLPVGMARSFITEIPKGGRLDAKLRFQLLWSNDGIVYSNEFSGKVDVCDFVEASENYVQRGDPHPHLTLDMLASE